jgi:hypothetical protein
MDNVTL